MLLKVSKEELDGVRIGEDFLYNFQDELAKNANVKKIVTLDVYDISITNKEMEKIIQNQLFSVLGW